MLAVRVKFETSKAWATMLEDGYHTVLLSLFLSLSFRMLSQLTGKYDAIE